jgi:hypothetical protein
MAQKENIYFHLRSGNSKIVQDLALVVLNYVDTRHSLFSSTRKITLKHLNSLISRLEDSKIRDVVEDNISYLKEIGTFFTKTKEVTAAIATNSLNILFPFLLYRRNGLEF